MSKRILIYIFILLLQLAELVEVHLIGTISVAGIIYVCWFAYNAITGVWNSELRTGLICRISILYLCLFSLQLLSEILVGNEVSNVLKGLAITVLSYMKVMCLWPFIKHDGRRLILLFACMVISGFVDFQFMTDNEFQMDSLIEGTEYSIFKFKIAPLIGELLVVYSLLSHKKNLVAILSLIFGAGCAILGARSTGLMIFLTGAIVLMINHMSEKITKIQIIQWSFVGCIIGYGLFVLYVSAVLNGTIVGGNSKEQFANVDNPYNPLSILLSGRTESPASLAAICDRPFTGFGAWAKDPRYKYHKVQAKAQRNVFVLRDGTVNIIPAHSVVLQTGVHYGIFAMIMMAYILYYFMKKGIQSMSKGCIYNYIVVFCIMQLIWNGLFSPLSHFRNEFPVFFCICLYAYRYSQLTKLMIKVL